jgi:hypothetical protein
MPRQGRLDFHRAIHYVCVRGRAGRSIFFDVSILSLPAREARAASVDLRQFELLLADACDECGSVVHAFTWQPNSAVLVMQKFGVPLYSVMGRVCGRYSKYLHKRAQWQSNRQVFQSRYDSRILAPEYLPHAIRRIERMPVEAGLCRTPLEYPFSSSRLMGDVVPPWLAMPSRSELQRRRASAPGGRNIPLVDRESAFVTALFEHGSKWDSRVIGDRVFVNEVHREAARPAPTPSRAQITDAVAQLVDRASIGPLSDASIATLKRALIARYAVRSGAATLTEVGRWFGVSAAALRNGIDRYRELLPDLFNRSFEELFGESIAA